MQMDSYKYVVIGGGLAGASAVQGIRELDRDGSILLIGAEKHLPYDRPPLSKKLWFGKMKVDDIFIKGRDFYESNSVGLALGSGVKSLDAAVKTVTCEDGRAFSYERLLLATGGAPRRLSMPGGDLEGIYYYRSLDDYQRMRAEAAEGKSATVIGGGFIGSEVAAALNINRLDVTMVFPSEYVCNRVFPEYLGTAIQQHFIERGVKVFSGDKPVSISREGGRYATVTAGGMRLISDIVVAGVGMEPETNIAKSAGLTVTDGVEVDEYLRSSHPDIYAAGDNASFPYQALGKRMRVEHWDNALNQGKQAGRNMAGASEQYAYMPYFFSDLFEFGYEAVGEVNSGLDTFADWQKENEKGVLYYLRDSKVRGVMMCNVWDKVPAARELILKGDTVKPEGLRGLIK